MLCLAFSCRLVKNEVLTFIGVEASAALSGGFHPLAKARGARSARQPLTRQLGTRLSSAALRFVGVVGLGPNYAVLDK